MPPGGLLIVFRTAAPSSGRYSTLPCDVSSAGPVASPGTSTFDPHAVRRSPFAVLRSLNSQNC